MRFCPLCTIAIFAFFIGQGCQPAVISTPKRSSSAEYPLEKIDRGYLEWTSKRLFDFGVSFDIPAKIGLFDESKNSISGVEKWFRAKHETFEPKLPKAEFTIEGWLYHGNITMNQKAGIIKPIEPKDDFFKSFSNIEKQTSMIKDAKIEHLTCTYVWKKNPELKKKLTIRSIETPESYFVLTIDETTDPIPQQAKTWFFEHFEFLEKPQGESKGK